MTPCPLNAKPFILVTGAAAGTAALAALPAILLGTVATATGGLLTGLNLGRKIKIIMLIHFVFYISVLLGRNGKKK